MAAVLQDVSAYRASGGDIVGPAGRLQPAAALDLLQRYGREAARRHRLGEPRAARLCALMALDVARAIVARDDWQCAAACIARSRSEHFSLRELVSDVKFPRYG